MSRNSRRAVAAIIAGMAVPAGLLAGGAAADAVTAHHLAATRIEVCGTGRAFIRPRSIILTCADHGELATNLHWTSWTAARATAVGEVRWKTATAAVPFASSRHWDHASARITLTRPVAEAGGKVLFTGARLHVTGNTPRGFLRNLTFDEGPAMAAAQAPSSGPAPSLEKPANGSSGTLTYSDIEGFWFDAGGPASVEETAAAISDAESYDGSPGAIEPDYPYDATGWGLWQITPGNSDSKYGEDYQLLDPWNNAEAAVVKYNGASGFSPWTTYTNGTYKGYLQNGITRASGLADPGQYDPINSAPSGTHNSSDPGSTYGPAMPSSALTNRASGKCMSNGGSQANSAPITQYTCNGSNNQQWYSNVDTIVSANSSDCLSNGGSTANSAPITQYPCDGSSNQGWHTVQGSGGYFTIQNAAGFCMTTGGSTANSAPVTQYACDGSDNQQWS
jgi:hypothetical protein